MVTSKQYQGKYWSFHYPRDGQIVESLRPDNTYLIRLLWHKNEVKYRYDLEKLNEAAPAKDLAERYFHHPIVQPEDLAPEKVTIGKQVAWHTRKVVFDGLRAVLIYDAYFFESKGENFRWQYLAYGKEYQEGLPTFEVVINSFSSCS